MVKDILLLGIGALFGLGVALVSLAIPTYLPTLPSWVAHWMFWGGFALMAIMVFDAALLYLWWGKPGPKVGPALLINLALCLFVGGLVWHYSPISTPVAPAPNPTGPDVVIRLIYPDMPALVLVNQSDSIARNIKWSVALWNVDDPRTYANPGAAPNAHDPLPIPVATFDFLRPHTSGGPQTVFNTAAVLPNVKPGQRLFGSASVVCAECTRGHTYLLNIVYGQGGWYTEVLDRKEGELVIPPHFTKELVQAYFQELMTLVPETARIPITKN